MTSKIEFVGYKIVALFAEAIPTSIFQVLVCLRALEKGEELSTPIIMSITIGVMTAGLTSAMISYDFDADPVKRGQEPAFYGTCERSEHEQTGDERKDTN